MEDPRLSRIENKLDKLTDNMGELKVKVTLIEENVNDIREKTIAHDNYTEDIDARLLKVEGWLDMFPKLRTVAIWAVSLAAGVKLVYEWFINR